MVKLLKYQGGRWVVVDYGVKSKVHKYVQQGYVVKH